MELLACYLEMINFQCSLKGRKFHVLTDHKQLTFQTPGHPVQHIAIDSYSLAYQGWTAWET